MVLKVLKGLGGRKFAGGYQWIDKDSNLTDIAINYQIKEVTFGSRNFLNLNAKLK